MRLFVLCVPFFVYVGRPKVKEDCLKAPVCLFVCLFSVCFLLLFVSLSTFLFACFACLCVFICFVCVFVCLLRLVYLFISKVDEDCLSAPVRFCPPARKMCRSIVVKRCRNFLSDPELKAIHQSDLTHHQLLIHLSCKKRSDRPCRVVRTRKKNCSFTWRTIGEVNIGPDDKDSSTEGFFFRKI